MGNGLNLFKIPIGKLLDIKFVVQQFKRNPLCDKKDQLCETCPMKNNPECKKDND